MPESRSPALAASSVARALDVVGDGWTLRILREAFRGARRYSQFEASLGVPKAVLAKRLARLVADGVLEQIEYSTAPVRHEYRLTEMGLDLWRIMLTIWHWETTWDPTPIGSRPTLVHLECGHECRPYSACDHCGSAVGLDSIARLPGPGAGPETLRIGRHQRRMNSRTRMDKGVRTMRSQAVQTTGDRWSPRILACFFRGLTRFNEIQADLAIPPSTLTQRLNELLEIELVERRPAATPGREEYALTRKGLDKYPLTLQLMRWGDRWLDGGKGLPVLMQHHACGQIFHADLRCSHCHGILTRTGIRLT